MRQRAPKLRTAAVTAAVVGLLAGCGSEAPRAVAEPAPAPTDAAASTRAEAVPAAIPGGDWMTFDYDAQRSGVGPSDTGITGADLGRLRRRIVHIAGIVDSTPVELHAVAVDGRKRDVVFVTTTYGRTVAFDPGTGATLWAYTPRSLGALSGSGQVTNATPVIDPTRAFLYTTSPDGFVHKLRVADGRPAWSTRVTLLPEREKLAGSLNVSGGSVLVATDGYYGDAQPYQGHVLLLDRASGHVTRVWNSLCSNRHTLIDPRSCPASDSAIFGRPGTVIEPGTGRILVATGNGPFNGATNWGDSVLELSPQLALLHHYTPVDQSHLNQSDTDLGSTEPALLPGGLAVQGGKDGNLRLLNLGGLAGVTPSTGGQLQEIQDPGGAELFAQPAVWNDRGRPYVFVADGSGTSAYVLGANRRLTVRWSDGTPGTSPLIAGGLLYIYDMNDGALVIRNPRSGRVLARLPTAPGHWNSPIVVGGRIIVPEGNYFHPSATGTISVYHLPGR